MGATAPTVMSLPDAHHLALELEVAELRQQLAAAQDMLVETAADAGRLHAENTALRDELARMRAEAAVRQISAIVRGRAVA
jgi:regulator of replication initiation timing